MARGKCCRCREPIDRKLIGARVCTACLRPAEENFKRRVKNQIRPSIRAAVIARDGMRCRYCGCMVRHRRNRRDIEPDTLEIDHIIAVADGGTNDQENLAVACMRCNRQKQGREAVARRRRHSE